MKKILTVTACTIGLLIPMSAAAEAAPKRPNAAWSQQCSTVPLAGPWKRFTPTRCVLVNIRRR